MTLLPAAMGPTNVMPYYMPAHQGMLSPGQGLISPTAGQPHYIYSLSQLELPSVTDTMVTTTPSPPTQHHLIPAPYTTTTAPGPPPATSIYPAGLHLSAAGVPLAPAPGIAMATHLQATEMPPTTGAAAGPPAGPNQPQSGGQSYPMSVTTNMEVVWHGEFDRWFHLFHPTQWRLLPIAAPPPDEFNIFQDSAKVRFQCRECGRGWTSMKGRVTFWYDVDEARRAGDIYFKLYGQQCKHCTSSEFEHAMWYPEEVVKVVFNLYMHIGQRYYGFVQPAIRVDRRQGKPRSQHDSKLCQACADGICKEAWSTAS